MGIDCRITLPYSARLRDVANAIGILAGLPFTTGQLQGGGLYVDVLRARPSALEVCAEIQWEGGPGIKPAGYVLWHWEGGDGGHTLLPRSTPFWCAVGRQLVLTFGGTVDYNDCDESDCDVSEPECSLNGATNGDDWDARQRRMLDLAPLTSEDLAPYRGVAGYPDIIEDGERRK